MHVKNLLIIIFVSASLLFSGCRSKRGAIPEAPAPAPRGTISDVVAEEEPQVVPSPHVVAKPVEEPVREPEPVPVSEREERFTFTQVQDQVIHDPNTYFVIMGSFRSTENAERFKDILAEQGFEPFVLISESGLHRVSIDSFTDETVARNRVQRIRNVYPEYKDAWLLIRKN